MSEISTEGPRQREGAVSMADGGAAHPGFWLIIFGCLIMFLAPLSGFLGGTMFGSTGGEFDINALTWWLVSGLSVGGVGVLVAALGAMRWVRASRQRRVGA